MRSWIRRWRRRGEAGCAEAATLLQSYLDGHIDELSARRVSRHLEHCRRCGLELETYRAIKDALAHRAGPIEPSILGRLHAFSQKLLEDGDGDDAGSWA